MNVLNVVECPFPKIRLGRDYDGGYIIADIPNVKYSKLVSGGISNDISFENAFIDKYNVDCDAFDGTINELPEANPRITFHRTNINNSNLKPHIQQDIFLKMDIEGAEWDFFDGLDNFKIRQYTNENMKKIMQMVVEFHYPSTDRQKWNVIKNIEKDFYLVHIHGNNCNTLFQYDGITVPYVFECTYLRKDLFKDVPNLNKIPLPIKDLDMPNNKNVPDIPLNFIPYCYETSMTAPISPSIVSMSPIQEGCQQQFNDTDTYYTRQTGRTANQIHEYVYWRLRSIQDGKRFICTYPNFIFKNADKIVPETEKVDKGFPLSVEPYPLRSSYYIPHRKEIKDFLKIDIPKVAKYDVVIHLRLDDVLNNTQGYSILPIRDYINIIKKIKNIQIITIIGNAIDEMQEEYARCIQRPLESLGYKVELSLKNSVEEDINILMSCRRLIASTSTFWFWSAFLSDVLQELYYPKYGVVYLIEPWNFTNWKEFDISLFPPYKITPKDLHRVFL